MNNPASAATGSTDQSTARPTRRATDQAQAQAAPIVTHDAERSPNRPHVPTWLIAILDALVFCGGVASVWNGTREALTDLLVLALPIVYLTFTASRMYRPMGTGARASFARSASAGLGAAFGIWFIAVVTDVGAESHRRVVPLLAGVAAVSVLRVVIRRIEYKLQGQQQWLIVTLGGPGSDEDLALTGKARAHKALKIANTVSAQAGDTQTLIENLGSVHAVVVAPSVPSEVGQDIVLRALGHRCTVVTVPDLYSLITRSGEPHQVDDLASIAVGDLELRLATRVVKRVIDVVGALVFVVLSAPILAACAVAIRLDSPGPAVYRQVRVGRHGKDFKVVKLRTMVQDAEVASGPVLATKADPRITRLGRFLRATRLDELPQMFNVLGGSMSLVGPRPERPELIVDLAKQVTGYDLRHLTKPGITGLAQVSARYNTSAADKLRFDLIYLQRHNLWLDARLLVQTLHVMMRPDQASGVAVVPQEQSPSRA
ncbi:MAG: exopolysaccharide biosynthesis polyprenyl glycosylphosphotransferase [Candidatus Poriferisodalaceae bacterium]|jgi:exopolysaccharide biosynthesis polyprenyl glycosylphosphotransferase